MAGLGSAPNAVLQRHVALLGCLEAHGLRELGLLAEVFELECLHVVLEGLHEPCRRLDLAELSLDDAVAGLEPVAAAGANVHLLNDGPLTPPFRDECGVRPDRVDVLARRIEDPLDTDLNLARVLTAVLFIVLPSFVRRPERSGPAAPARH